MIKFYNLFLGPILAFHDKEAYAGCGKLDMVKTCAAFEMPSSCDVHHCFVVGFGDDCRSRLFQEECEVEDIGDCHLAGHRVQHLCRDSDLHIVALCEADLRVEVEHCSNFDWSSKENVVHVKNRWSGLAKNIRVCPGELKGLSHDEPSVDLVVDVPVVRLADDQVLKVGVLKPSRVFRFYSRLKKSVQLI